MCKKQYHSPPPFCASKHGRAFCMPLYIISSLVSFPSYMLDVARCCLLSERCFCLSKSCCCLSKRWLVITETCSSMTKRCNLVQQNGERAKSFAVGMVFMLFCPLRKQRETQLRLIRFHSWKQHRFVPSLPSDNLPHPVPAFRCTWDSFARTIFSHRHTDLPETC